VNEFTALAYARVSTDDKDQTTATQIREIKKWCESNNIAILETYSEEKSAGDLNRPELDRMLGRLFRERIDFVVAWSESRLSRDTDDMVNILRVLRQFGVKVRYVSTPIEPETSTGSLLNHIGTWQGQIEREKLSINTANGMATARLKGTHCGRPLALVFEHRFEENRSRIRFDGDAPTRVVTLESIMEYAKMGFSVDKAAQAIGVSRNTLTRELGREGALEEYRRTYEIVKANPFMSRQKGVAPKRADPLYSSTAKKPSDVVVEKGSLVDKDVPLLNIKPTHEVVALHRAKGADPVYCRVPVKRGADQ